MCIQAEDLMCVRASTVCLYVVFVRVVIRLSLFAFLFRVNLMRQI